MKLKKPKYAYTHVMLIDDSDLDNFINEKMIESSQFAEKVYVHTSARSALEFLSNLNRMGEQFASAFPKIIFIDINMPLIDGFQFIEQFRQNSGFMSHNAKLVILTSSVNTQDRKKAQDISAGLGYLNKPLSRQMLDTLKSS